MKKIIILSIALFAACLISAKASAATLTPGPLTITYSAEGSIFSESNLSPGDKVIKDLTVTNNGRISHNFAIATRNVSGDLGSIITLSAVEAGNTVWTNTLTELQDLPTVSKFITSLNPGQTKTISLEANFPDSAVSNLAGKNVTFDIVYGTEEAEPVVRTLGIFTSNPPVTQPVAPSESATVSATASSTPEGEVKGETTGQDESGIDPWFLIIAPAAVLAAFVFLPEFAFAGGLAAISGGAAYVLGYTSSGTMDPTTFYIILGAEIITLLVLAYFMLHHDNRASRRIRGYHHRLRIR